MDSLRSEQKFKVVNKTDDDFILDSVSTKTNDVIEMELCGEEAERFVEAIEEKSKELESDFIPFSNKQDHRDMEAIRSARITNKSLLRGQETDRIYTSDLHKGDTSSSKSSKDFILDAPVVVDGDDEDWEDELLKRGAFSASFTASHTTKIQSKSSKTQTNATFSSKTSGKLLPSSDVRQDKANGTSVSSEIMKSLRFAIEKLSVSVSAADRSVSQLDVEIARSDEISAKLQAAVEAGVSKLHIIEATE